MAKRSKADRQPAAIENRKARHDYEILETLEVGIALTGSEVKSVRNGQASLAEGYVRVQEAPLGLFLHSVNIAEYGPAGAQQPKPLRTRPLLAHKREIEKLLRLVQQKGLTIVPLKMYFKGSWAKVLIGVAQGRSKVDKRHAIAKREADRDVQRAMTRKFERGG